MENLIKMATSTMIIYNKTRYAKNLLDACQHWTGDASVTMQDFSQRLKWNYGGYDKKQGSTWYLDLDSFCIGWYAGFKKYLPKINNEMCQGHLNILPVLEGKQNSN